MSASYITSRQLRRKLPLVDRFLFRETRTEAVASAGKRPINPEPFVPYKSPTSGRWMPPRLSLRRQAQLAKEAYRQGQFEPLTAALQEQGKVEGVKMGKMKARIGELVAEAERKGAGVEAYQSTALPPASRAEESKKALKLARALAASRGPYQGRSLRNIFKGTKAEREAPGKRLQTVQKMAAMAKTVETWRKTKTDAKNKSRPTLPF